VTNYYVYYKADLAKREALQRAVAELFDAVKKETGLAGKWMHRRDDAATYMEVFEGVRDEAGFEELLARESVRLEFTQFLQAGGTRRVERFVCA
jgi:quinol monooxygenase YgiN